MLGAANLRDNLNGAGNRQGEIPLYPPDEVLKIVTRMGEGVAGGMNRTNLGRERANLAEAKRIQELEEPLSQLSVKQLRLKFDEEGITTLPMIWKELRCECGVCKANSKDDNRREKVLRIRGDLKVGQMNIQCKYTDGNGVPYAFSFSSNTPSSSSSSSSASSSSSPSLLQISGGGHQPLDSLVPIDALIRLGKETEDSSNEFTIKSIREDPEKNGWVVTTSITYEPPHSLPAGSRGLMKQPIFHHTLATRKRPFIDMLVQKALQEERQKAGRDIGGGIHQGGFDNLYTLMAGGKVDCPMCLSKCVRPTTPKCVHVVS